MTKRLLPPKVDFVFKLLFGDQRNDEILTAFLKSVLTFPEEEYDSIAFADPQLKKEHEKDKLGVIDLRIHTKSGNIIHVEMQVLPQLEMPERITYYNAKTPSFDHVQLRFEGNGLRPRCVRLIRHTGVCLNRPSLRKHKLFFFKLEDRRRKDFVHLQGRRRRFATAKLG